MQRNRLTAIFVIVFIDLLGFGLILPLLPFYAESFGATATLVGLFVASYAAAQFVGAPVLGRLSDRYGRRPVLLIAIFGNLVSFVMLGVAHSLAMLFVSRILAGLTAGDISVAQAYISDVTDERSRTRALGLIGAAFGLGFILGPGIGGVLSAGGFAVPAFAAAGVSALNLLMVLLWLPESLTPERRAELAKRPAAAFTPRALWSALNRPLVGPLLHTRFFFGLAFAAFQSIFALYAQDRLGLTAQGTGYVLAYVGVLSVLVQGVAIGWLTNRIDESRLILGSVALMALAMLGWALVSSLPMLLVVLAPMALSGGVLTTVLNSALTKSVRPEEIGGTLGLGAAVESLTRVIAPFGGAALLQLLGPSAPGFAASLMLAALTSYVWRRVIPSAGVRPSVGSWGARAIVTAADIEA